MAPRNKNALLEQGAGETELHENYTLPAAQWKGDLVRDLVREINAEHDRAFGKAREALEHARRAGELLIQAKAGLSHGAFGQWLASNCKFSDRTARAYMRLASHWNELQAKTAAVADLGLRDALGLLSEPRPERTHDGFTYTPKEEELLAKASAAGGVDTIAEYDCLTQLQRRLMQHAIDNLEAALADGVSHLSADELHHALECCDDCARMCEDMLPRVRSRDCDLIVAIQARELLYTIDSLTTSICRALEVAA